MNNCSFILLCVSLWACNSTSNSYNTGTDGEQHGASSETIETEISKGSTFSRFEVDPNLIDEFYTDDSLTLENPTLKSELVQEFMYDLDRDEEKDKVLLYRIKQLEEDPGDFHRIRIELANGKTNDVLNVDGWIRDKNPAESKLNTDWLAVLEHKDFTLLMCYGWYYASDPSQITIFDFTKREPRIIFHKNFDIGELILEDSIILTGYEQYESPDPSQPARELKTLRISRNVVELAGSSNR